jgi:hypothetical protein
LLPVDLELELDPELDLDPHQFDVFADHPLEAEVLVGCQAAIRHLHHPERTSEDLESQYLDYRQHLW